MREVELLIKAVKMAKEAHEGQVDQAGAEYIFHPLMVMLMGWTLEEQIVGVLHDVVEHAKDPASALQRIYAEFGETIGDALDAITRRPDETYMQYIERLSHNAIARNVKRKDLDHNLSRLDANANYATLRKRYEKARDYLMRSTVEHYAKAA